MKHSATKLSAGKYDYRGYTVETVGKVWFITSPGCTDADDAANTKSQAMADIDIWCA